MVDPENLVRMAKDSLQVHFTLLRLEPSYGDVAADREYISSISDLISRDATSPTRLSSAEATVLTETSHQVPFPPLGLPVSELPGGQTLWELSWPQQMASWRLWFRLRAHTFLLRSGIFPNMELNDGFLDYIPFGFADTWKGSYHGEPVCIKVLRIDDSALMRESKMV